MFKIGQYNYMIHNYLFIKYIIKNKILIIIIIFVLFYSDKLNK